MHAHHPFNDCAGEIVFYCYELGFHSLQTRRRFLRTSIRGAGGDLDDHLLQKCSSALDAMAAEAVTQAVTGKDGTILVVLQMAGGNDGLNMVVPFAG